MCKIVLQCVCVPRRRVCGKQHVVEAIYRWFRFICFIFQFYGHINRVQLKLHFMRHSHIYLNFAMLWRMSIWHAIVMFSVVFFRSLSSSFVMNNAQRDLPASESIKCHIDDIESKVTFTGCNFMKLPVPNYFCMYTVYIHAAVHINNDINLHWQLSKIRTFFVPFCCCCCCCSNPVYTAHREERRNWGNIKKHVK